MPESRIVFRLNEGVGRIAAACYPKPVIVRTSDFKTNEDGRLIGGAVEPREEKRMLGFCGASRYCDERYVEAFAHERQALARARRGLGPASIKAMIPFCRTVEEARRVIDTMDRHGLSQGVDGGEV